MTLDNSPDNQIFAFAIDDEDAGERLDVFLAGLDDPPLTRSQVKRRIVAGEVIVNGAIVKAGHMLRVGDEIAWRFAPDQPLSAAAQDIPLSILFEDPQLAIIDKPHGMVVHPSIGHADGTLVNAILHHFARVATTGDALRPGIVHRIDKDTSGAIAITKTQAAHQHLSALFAAHDIERAYHALVVAPRLDDEGTFDTLHGRHPTARLKFSSQVERGRRAVTHYRVLERFDNHAALVECRLETGRTHQIRVHLSDAGAPLLGDELYSPKNIGQTKVISRQALHARTLGFVHLDGSQVHVEAPYPADFEFALAELRRGARI